MKYLIHSNYGIGGGHHSVHQISAALTELSQENYMIYPPVGHDSVVPLWTELYGVKNFLHREQTEDEADQVHLLPAMWGPNWYPCDGDTPSCIKKKSFNSKKVFYWLGVVPWQDWEFGGVDRDVDLNHTNMQKMYHACQSRFAYEFLMKSGKIDPRTIFMLRDYTNKFFLHTDYELFTGYHKRNNIVLFNGAKGLQHSFKIMEECRDLNCTFVRLENLDYKQMKEAALRAKVYIDFGHHPGKDRIPREMASCGCVVITGDEGTAACDADVPVGPRKFKSVQGQYDYQAIREQIKLDIYDYMAGFLDEHQVRYRMSIRREKDEVYEDVRNMLKVVGENIL